MTATPTYRRQMFRAWHDEHDRAFARVASEHADGQSLGVFGTPTVVFGEGQVALVKLDALPEPDRSETLWRSVRELATGQPALRECQRVSPSEAG